LHYLKAQVHLKRPGFIYGWNMPKLATKMTPRFSPKHIPFHFLLCSKFVLYGLQKNYSTSFCLSFRFIYKYKSTIEIQNYEYVKNIVKRDFSTYCGKFLEKWFIEKLKQTHQYSQIGNYWERGNKNEINIVAVNEIKKTMLIAEVKINSKKISVKKLQEKSKKLIQRFLNYKLDFTGFSLKNLTVFILQ